MKFPKPLSAVLVVAMLVTVTVVSIPADDTMKEVTLVDSPFYDSDMYKVSFEYSSGGQLDYRDVCYYTDEYFFTPSTSYDQSLATASLCFAMSAFHSFKGKGYSNGSDNVEHFLKNTGFLDFEANEDFGREPTTDSIGLAIANKHIHDGEGDYTLIALAVRGSGYGAEWVENFQIGTGDESYGHHEGFYNAMNRTLDFMESYIESKNITGDIQIESEGSIGRDLAENIKIAFGACMPEKLQNLSEKIIHIKSNNGEADKKFPVKYLSEIINARVEEILMAIFYEIHESGFANKLMSGIVVTGGSAQIANLGNLISTISGYRVRTGYPRHTFSFQGCEGAVDTSAATSIGLIMAAKNDHTLNCAFSAEGYVPPFGESGAEETEPVTDPFAETTAEPENDMKTTLIDFETVEAPQEPKKPKERKPRTIKWSNPFSSIGKFCGNLYETVQQDINEEN